MYTSMQSSGKTTELVITSLGRDRFNKNRIRRVKCNKSYKNEVNKKPKERINGRTRDEGNKAWPMMMHGTLLSEEIFLTFFFFFKYPFFPEGIIDTETRSRRAATMRIIVWSCSEEHAVYLVKHRIKYTGEPENSRIAYRMYHVSLCVLISIS